MHIPKIINADADKNFRSIALKMNRSPDDLWVGRYVEYEWAHIRYHFEEHADSIKDKIVLEFGCNIGASSIILGILGGNVTAVDTNPFYIELAKANAERYGLESKIRFICVQDSTKFPFRSESFDFISCNSVFEYVQNDILRDVQREIDRVTKKGGVIMIAGTSNRLWPREVHSKKWVNYVPRFFDFLLFKKKIQQGIFPWEIVFNGYENIDLEDKGKKYLDAKLKMGISHTKYCILKIANQILNYFDLTVGMFTPYIYLTLRKRNERE